MGVRGEIFSTRVILPNRTYFFNVKENRMGDLYLNVVESKNRETGGFDRQSVILFADDLQEFLKGFDESLRVLEKAVREKRRPSGENAKRGERHEEKSEHPEKDRYNYSGEKSYHREKTGRGGSDRYYSGEKSGRGERNKNNYSGEKSARVNKNRKSERGFDRGPKGNKSGHGSDRESKGGRRVVVRKQER
jgi:hypothetical protein